MQPRRRRAMDLSFLSRQLPFLRFNMCHDESPLILGEWHRKEIRPCRLPSVSA
jgi:hypothetical protein